MELGQHRLASDTRLLPKRKPCSIEKLASNPLPYANRMVVYVISVMVVAQWINMQILDNTRPGEACGIPEPGRKSCRCWSRS